MTCEVRNKEINSQCAEILVRPLYHPQFRFPYFVYFKYNIVYYSPQQIYALIMVLRSIRLN